MVTAYTITGQCVTVNAAFEQLCFEARVEQVVLKLKSCALLPGLFIVAIVNLREPVVKITTY